MLRRSSDFLSVTHALDPIAGVTPSSYTSVLHVCLIRAYTRGSLARQGALVKNTDVLVSGAGIAGIALAFWLSRNDFTVTLVERAPAVRLGGYKVDIRGAAEIGRASCREREEMRGGGAALIKDR